MVGPYASSAGMVTLTLSPTDSPMTAFSKPGITFPSPMTNSSGFDPQSAVELHPELLQPQPPACSVVSDESKTDPSSRVPV